MLFKLSNSNNCKAKTVLINEYLKSTRNIFIEIYEQLFNIIFETGNFPDNWLIFGTHKPVLAQTVLALQLLEFDNLNNIYIIY
jgi:hypothetical protein